MYGFDWKDGSSTEFFKDLTSKFESRSQGKILKPLSDQCKEAVNAFEKENSLDKGMDQVEMLKHYMKGQF